MIPAKALHPGEVLREELAERGIKQKDFAKQIGVQASHLNEFIKGKRDLNKDLAMKLEEHTSISFNNWMNLQNGYYYDRNAIARREQEEVTARRYEDECGKIFNINILYKKLGISSFSCAERLRQIKDLLHFDLLSAESLQLQLSGFYKHSEKAAVDDKNMLAWLILNQIRIEKAARVEYCFRKGEAEAAAKEIAQKANNRNLSVSFIKECLNKHGIQYVEVEKLEKAPIDAYSTMHNGHPVISVTYRYNDMDKLAFDIIHELYHIDNHLSDTDSAFIAIDSGMYSADPREREANAFAQRTLIPDSVWKEIMRTKSSSLSPHIIVRTIAKSAEREGVSPSIAVARYKRETNWYKTSSFRSPKIF